MRVRVALKYGSYPSSNETFSYGEVEDYDLKVVASGSQPDPDPDPNPDPNPDPEPDPDVDNYDSLTYPESYSKNYSYMYIKSVTIGNMTNASSGSTYTYYPDKQVNASSGATLSVSFTPGFSYYRYYTYWQMWLDSDVDQVLRIFRQDVPYVMNIPLAVFMLVMLMIYATSPAAP